MKGSYQSNQMTTKSYFRPGSPRFNLKHALSGTQLLSILAIAHKYCMDRIEENILEVLNGATSTAEYVDLLVGAQIIGSDSSYQKALEALKISNPKPDLAQAKRMGVEATYAVMEKNLTCPSCSYQTGRYCGHCGTYS
jgi:hypothetical protein